MTRIAGRVRARAGTKPANVAGRHQQSRGGARPWVAGDTTETRPTRSREAAGRGAETRVSGTNGRPTDDAARGGETQIADGVASGRYRHAGRQGDQECQTDEVQCGPAHAHQGNRNRQPGPAARERRGATGRVDGGPSDTGPEDDSGPNAPPGDATWATLDSKAGSQKWGLIWKQASRARPRTTCTEIPALFRKQASRARPRTICTEIPALFIQQAGK